MYALLLSIVSDIYILYIYVYMYVCVYVFSLLSAVAQNKPIWSIYKKTL